MLLIVPQGLRLLDNAITRRIDQAGRRATFERMLRLAEPLPRRARRAVFRPVLSQFGGRLHTIGLGSSALDEDVARRWMTMGVDVLQGYGATEMGPAISFTRPERNRLGTVGEIIPGVEVRLAADGEILARGPNRFVGYWQDPDKTADAIDPDGWYHTGDLGRLSVDGFLVLLGRKKDMLALPDGQKVYPEDVEAVLALDDRLKDATVVGWPPSGDLRVHAVLQLDEPAHAEAIVRDANARLGAHQQIRGFTVWPDDELPRTHTLKVRKHDVLARLTELSAQSRVGSSAGARTGSASEARSVRGGPAPDDVSRLAASIAGIDATAVLPTSRLSSDLNMDSLQRVELLGVIEEELGAFIDDADLDPDATVAELSAMLDAARSTPTRRRAWTWPLHPVVRGVGLAVQTLVMSPLVRLVYRIEASGLERLDALEGPVLITPNHCLHTDNLIILSAFPLRVRWKLSIAAAADTIYDNPVQGFLASVLANAFPLQREGGVRRSLELLGARLDRGFSILLYPEGQLTVGGPLQPFKAGAGLIAVGSATPVLPVRLRVRRMSLVDRRRLPAALRGDVELVVGEPLRFDADTDPSVATSRLEEAVATL
jgi:long-chain acyl-CoA synthetase